MRVAMVAMVLALGCAGAGVLGVKAQADDLHVTAGSGDYRVLLAVADARAEFGHRDYDNVVEALKPDLQPAVFKTLSAPMRYEVLRLYARSLYGLSNWDEAHEAFVDLTRSSHATRQDWLLRLDTAVKVGDKDDAQLAHDRLQDSLSAADEDKGDIV